MLLLERGFHILIKNVSFSSPTDVGSHNLPPSGPSILAGIPVSGSNTVCNSPSSPFADIVLFKLFILGFSSRFIMRLLGRDFHTFTRMFRSPPQPKWDLTPNVVDKITFHNYYHVTHL